MRASSSLSSRIGREAHRARKTHAAGRKFTQLDMKIYEFFLFFIMVSAIWCILTNTFYQPDDFENQEKTVLGLLDRIVHRISMRVNRFLEIFLSDPIIITLLMLCAIARLVVNFVTLHFVVSVRQFAVGYSIDESHFEPLMPEAPFEEV